MFAEKLQNEMKQDLQASKNTVNEFKNAFQVLGETLRKDDQL